jgi:hypothetical protein
MDGIERGGEERVQEETNDGETENAGEGENASEDDSK